MQSFRFFYFQRGERGLSGTAFFLVRWFARTGMAKGLAGFCVVVHPGAGGSALVADMIEEIPKSIPEALYPLKQHFPGSLTRNLYRKKIPEIMKIVDIVPKDDDDEI